MFQSGVPPVLFLPVNLSYGNVLKIKKSVLKISLKKYRNVSVPSVLLQNCHNGSRIPMVLLCSKRGQHGNNERLLCLSSTSFTSICHCVQIYFGAKENSKVFLKRIQKTSVPFSFFRGFMKGADR